MTGVGSCSLPPSLPPSLLTSPSRCKEDISDTPGAVCNAIALRPGRETRYTGKLLYYRRTTVCMRLLLMDDAGGWDELPPAVTVGRRHSRKGIPHDFNPKTGRRRIGGDIQVAVRRPQHPFGPRQGGRRQRSARWGALGGRGSDLPKVCTRGLPDRVDHPSCRQRRPVGGSDTGTGRGKHDRRAGPRFQRVDIDSVCPDPGRGRRTRRPGL